MHSGRPLRTFAMGNSPLFHGKCQSETSSTCSTETETSAHNFVVRDYPLLEGICGGKFVRSSMFNVGGHGWTIRFYPNGDEKGKSSDKASCFLECDKAKDVRAWYSLDVVETLDGQVQLTNFGCTENTFCPQHCNWGYPRFASKSKLRALSNANNGRFTIRCVVMVIHKSRTVRNRRPIEVPPPSLRESLEHMLKDGEGADVTFSVRHQLFNAHRCVLAVRSPVFKAELFGPLKESTTRHIEVDDMEPQVFAAFLHFMYTDAMLDDDDEDEGKIARLQHLLVAADRYGVNRLKLMCEDKLYEGIDVETVATTLLLAEQHHCKDLKEACIPFMTSPRDMLRAAMVTNGFKKLVARCPLLMEDILKVVSST